MENDTEWSKDIWHKLEVKLEKVAHRSKDKLPYTTNADGVHNDLRKEKSVTAWTNGFWGGMMWIMYAGTGNEFFRECARHSEKLLDEAFVKYDDLDHDVGFIWHITAGADHKITGSREAYLRNMYAANLLAGRYKINGGYIRAWNDWGGTCHEGFSIIDTMMNIAQLYWASDMTHDDRYKEIAMSHADMAASCHVRSDGSVYHIVNHDPQTGEVTAYPAGQGKYPGSSWSRGQAWAIYGFAISYIHTGKEEYLDIAKRAAHYFIAAVCGDYLPRCDFRSPAQPVYYDSTAGAVAASGLLEIAKHVSEYEKDMYQGAAMRILRRMEERFCDWSDDTDAVLLMGTEAYGEYARKNIPIIYGDYFFAEAIYKCVDGKVFFW